MRGWCTLGRELDSNTNDRERYDEEDATLEEIVCKGDYY